MFASGFLILSDVLGVKFIITNLCQGATHIFIALIITKNNLTVLDFFKRTHPLNWKFLS